MLSKRGRKCMFLATVTILANLLFIYKTDSLSSILSCHQTEIKILRKIVNPPQLTETEEQILTYSSSKDKVFLADRLSNIVQSQLKSIQSPTNCSGPNFMCGHYDKCGFGCQVHHRVACLMISYALSIPLIHNEEEGWPFSMSWSHLFEPLGTSCPPGVNTFRWSWKDTSALYRGTPCLLNSETLDQIEFPLLKGLPVSKTLADLVEKIHPNPFLWWVGQFMKFTLKPRRAFQEKLDIQKKKIGFTQSLVGFHVRRTDKVTEYLESHHEIKEYFTAAQGLLTNVSKDHDVEGNQSLQRKVFIASDDSDVLLEARRKFLDWNITGFPSNQTLIDMSNRIDAFEDIARDVLILSECDYIVCGLTSNICRLLLEVLSSKHLDSEQRLASLDGKYAYIIQRFSWHDPMIVKVDPLLKISKASQIF